MSLALAFLFLAVHSGRAEAAKTNATDLTEIPLEKLMDVEVTSPSKKAEKLSQSPVAISVVTQDDIRRSGATSIPEALRLVPGLDVAQVDAYQWAVSARGFNDIFASRLLVLEDGRSVYTPLFSGVFWDAQDTMMSDIDRIEVIRGPGGSLWGVNALNGVINIITKSARDTQGIQAEAGGGTLARVFGSVRYGDQLAEDVYFRIYGQYFFRTDSEMAGGGDAHDAWQRGQGGFRLDWDTLEKGGNLLTLQGDMYGGILDQTFGAYAPLNPPTYSQLIQQDNYTIAGGNALGRWTHNFSESADVKLQMYYDQADQNTAIFTDHSDTFDVDLQQHFGPLARNDIIWGLGYRYNLEIFNNTPTVSLEPTRQITHLYSAFAQDEITLVPDRLRLTLGTKLEHDDFTGFEFQPSGRLLWTPTARQTIWGSVSRAVRTPSLVEEDATINRVLPPDGLFPGSPPAVLRFEGLGSFASEKLIAYELGYRVEPCAELSLDLTIFYNDYTDLGSEEPLAQPVPPPLVIPYGFENKLHGDTYGVEVAPSWQVTDWWRLQPAYSLLRSHLAAIPGSLDQLSVPNYEGQSPQQQVSLRSVMDLPHNLSFDWDVRYVDELPFLNIGSYVAADVRLGWRPTRNLELAVVGQNLGGRHAEFAPTYIQTQSTEVSPSVYFKVTWRFARKH